MAEKLIEVVLRMHRHMQKVDRQPAARRAAGEVIERAGPVTERIQIIRSGEMILGEGVQLRHGWGDIREPESVKDMWDRLTQEAIASQAARFDYLADDRQYEQLYNCSEGLPDGVQSVTTPSGSLNDLLGTLGMEAYRKTGNDSLAPKDIASVIADYEGLPETPEDIAYYMLEAERLYRGRGRLNTDFLDPEVIDTASGFDYAWHAPLTQSGIFEKMLAQCAVCHWEEKKEQVAAFPP